MTPHVCPWWGGYFIDNRVRRWLHNPNQLLAPYVWPGASVMDFGCGMGLFSIAMAEIVGLEGRVLAVDLQQKMLDVLTQRAAKAGVAAQIQTHRCQANSLHLDQTVDFAMGFYSVHEAPDPRRLLDEVQGLLPVGGKFLIVEPIGHVTKAHFQQMLETAAEVGFQVHERPTICLSHAVVLEKKAT